MFKCMQSALDVNFNWLQIAVSTAQTPIVLTAGESPPVQEHIFILKNKTPTGNHQQKSIFLKPWEISLEETGFAEPNRELMGALGSAADMLQFWLLHRLNYTFPSEK